MIYQRGHQLKCPTRAEAHARNLKDKKQLVEQGRTHGILVYATDEPVGWCQYGPTAELPFPNADPVHKGVPAEDPTSQWRITCFVTHKKHRRQGIAGIALAAALDSIREQGGGWVEATPIAGAYAHIDRRVRQLQRTHGRGSAEVDEYIRTRTWPEIVLPGIGPVKAARGSFGNVSHQGTTSLFERHGFTPVRIVRDTHVLMRRHL